MFVDKLSNMVHLASCWNTLCAQDFSHILVKATLTKHGLSVTEFLSSPRKSGQRSVLRVKLCLSSRHPHPTEHAKHTLGDMLRHVVRRSHDDWGVKLPSCEFASNNAWKPDYRQHPVLSELW